MRLGTTLGITAMLYASVSGIALSLNFLTATIDSTGAPDADSGTTQLTYTNRTSHAMQYNSDGVLEYGPHNLCRNSEDLDTLWGNTNATLAKDATDPDGGTTAYTMTDDGTAGYHYINQPNLAMTTDTTWTFWAKAGTLDYVAMSLAGLTGSAANCIFVNLSAGTIVSTGSRFDSSSIEDVGNGWYKVTCSRETYGSNYDNMCFQMSTDGTIAGCNYTGSGDTVLLWRPYVRNTNSPDTYIETTNAAKYGARISHKPVTNLLSYPEQFDNAAWTNTRSSETSGQTDPFSGTNAFKLVEDGTASSTHFIQQANSVTYVSGKTYTFSCYAKADERTFVELEFGTEQFPTSSHAFFNLSTGAVGTEGAGVASSGIAAVTGATGWYRCWITATADASGSTTDANVYLCDADNSNSFTGDSSSGAVLFGAQVNEGGIEDYIGCTNLLDNDKDADAWSKTKVVVTDSGTGPDGNTAQILTDDSATGTGECFVQKNSLTLPAAGTYEVLMLLKEDQLGWARIYVSGYDSTKQAYYDLSNVALGASNDEEDATITQVAGGWCECKLKFTTSSDLSGSMSVLIAEADNDTTVDRDGTSSIGFAGAQLTLLKTEAEYVAEPVVTEMFPNGTFDTDTTGWIAQTGVTIEAVGGQMVVTGNDQSSKRCYAVITTVVGTWYKYSFDVVGGDVTSHLIRVGYSVGQALYGTHTTVGTHSNIFMATTTYTVFTVYSEDGKTAIVDNFSLEEVTPSTASYPYVGMPQTGYTRAGYIAEPAATNLITESNDLTAAAWTINNTDSLTATADQSIGADGQTTLDEIKITDTTTETHLISDSVTISSNTDYAIAFDVRGGAQRYVGINLYISSENFATVVYDLYEGTVATTDVGTTSGTVTDSGVIPLNNGLYKIWAALQVTGTASTIGLATYNSASPTFDASGLESYAGTANDEFYAGAAQVELGIYPSSHFPTTGGSATRAADLLEETGFSYYNATEGTLIYEGSPVQPVTAATDRVTFNNDTANEVLKITDDASANTDFDVTDGGVSQASIDSGENAVNGVRRIVAAGYKENDFGASIDGATAVTDVSGTVPTPTQLVFGDGYHRSFKYWDDNSALATRSLSTDDGTAWRDNQ